MKKYTETHEWLVHEGETATVGITRYAADQIGDTVHVELPKIGDKVLKDDVACVIESSKAAIDICSPVTGIICEVNIKLQETPELVGNSPEDDGWLFKVNAIEDNGFEHLLDGPSYHVMFSL